jgi:hypothetical protein
MNAEVAIAKAEQSPEVVAARAAVHLLMQQETVLSREVDRLAEERKTLQADLASMLITKQDTRETLDSARRQHGELASKIAAIFRQTETAREEYAAMAAHKGDLQTHVDTLRSEIELLERARIGASRAATAANGVPKPEHRRAPSAPSFSPDGKIRSRAQLAMMASPEAEAAEEAAFDDFFNTELEHDKARDWILSEAR